MQHQINFRHKIRSSKDPSGPEKHLTGILMGNDFWFRALGFSFTIEITAVTKMVLNPFNHTSTLTYELEVQIQGLADPSGLFNNLGSCG